MARLLMSGMGMLVGAGRPPCMHACIISVFVPRLTEPQRRRLEAAHVQSPARLTRAAAAGAQGPQLNLVNPTPAPSGTPAPSVTPAVTKPASTGALLQAIADHINSTLGLTPGAGLGGLHSG